MPSPSETKAPPHPMVAVPDAIRTVLEITAKTILTRSQARFDELPTNAPSSQLLGRILAEDVLMSQPGYPPYRASIMDGYAIQCEKHQGPVTSSIPWSHQVNGRVHAGPSGATNNESNQNDPTTSDTTTLPSAVYVTTGARIPDTHDCVVPIELIEESTDQTHIKLAETATIETGKWIRGVGCDITAGSVVIPRGSVIHPVSLGLLQQSGQAIIKLVQPIRVGVLSTGNELLMSTDAWQQNTATSSGLIQTGQIPDVNKPILQALLTTFGNCQPIDLGMERDDDIESMAKTIQDALKTCDVILTTGGISMGETDIVEDVLVERLGGTLHFGRLNMKPGKPTTFVSIDRPTDNNSNNPACLVFALPGNPVSATVCTQLLVRPALNMLQQYSATDTTTNGQQAQEIMVQNTLVPPEVMATLTHDIKLDMERPEYHRIVLGMKQSASGDGGDKMMEYTATSTGVQRSSRLMSLRDAQGVLVLPRGTKDKPKALAGQQYTVLLLDTSHPPVLFQNSQHLKPKLFKRQQPTRVAITHVLEDSKKYPSIAKDDISARVEKALSGSRSGAVEVVSYQEISSPPEESWSGNFFSSNTNHNAIDVCVVSCSGSFSYCLRVSKFLREQAVSKIADSLALQARRGGASQDGTAALFEPVVGYLNLKAQQQEDGCILIALPTKGLEGGLDNVRGLLKHALNVARGKQHNHHQKHGHH